MYLKNKMFNKSLINKRITLSNHKLLNGRVLQFPQQYYKLQIL